MAGSKTWTFTQWRAWAVGKNIDIDGAYGAQCWDLWADYAIRCHGAVMMSTWTSANAGSDSGYASSLWTAFPARPCIENQFVKLGRDTTPREGDVVIWARSAAFPGSHVAIATGRTKPGLIECISQNDLGSATAANGATRVAWLTTSYILGYLRPKTSASSTPAIGQEEAEMHTIIVDEKDVFGVSPEYVTHYGDSLQFKITNAVTGNGKQHKIPLKEFLALLDGLGIPRDVVRGDKVLNPQSGKYERNGTWSRHREILAALAGRKA